MQPDEDKADRGMLKGQCWLPSHLQDRSDFLVNGCKASGSLWKLFLHLLTLNEEGLQIGPCSLDLAHQLVNVRHAIQILVPAKDLISEGIHVSVGNHALHHLHGNQQLSDMLPAARVALDLICVQQHLSAPIASQQASAGQELMGLMSPATTTGGF